jgi:small subunit ribosomal protein S6
VNNYELTVILKSGDVTENLKEKVKSILQKYGVTVVSEDPWGVKKLAYEISNETEGYYYFLNIQAPTDSVQKSITDFRLIADILRFLFIKLNKSA